MENRQYLSVMTVPSSSGTLSFTINTYDTTPLITLSASVTGITSGESEKSVANKIKSQLSIILTQNNLKFNGSITELSSTTGPEETFRLTRTDHVVCFFSEAQFSIDITNPTGSIIMIDPNPALITVTDAIAYGGALGETYDGLTNQQIAYLILLASSQIVSIINNPFVLSTYVHEHWGRWDESIKLEYTPLASVDNPRINRPDILSFLSVVSTSEPLTVYDIQAKTGWIAYKYAQEVFNAYEPFDDNTGFRISYVAGEKSLPAALKKAIIEMTSHITDLAEGLKLLQGGTFQVQFSTTTDQMRAILLPLEPYFLGGF